MRIIAKYGPADARSRRRNLRALTLAELMVTLGIFSFVVLAVIQLHMFGLRQDQIVGTKLGASDHARLSFGRLLSDIRGAKLLGVGNMTSSSFQPIADNARQEGTALLINPTPNTNSFILYFFDTQARELRRRESGSPGFQVIARNLTNNMSFRAEDYRGNVLTEREHNYVIRTLLEFSQFTYPLTQVGNGHHYDYYRIDFRATRRSAD